MIAAACFVVTIWLEAEVAMLFIGAGVLGILYYGSLFRRASAPTPLLALLPMGIGTQTSWADAYAPEQGPRAVRERLFTLGGFPLRGTS